MRVFRKVVSTVIAIIFFSINSHASTNGVIFMYHRFGESKYPSTNIKIEQFKQQLDFLEAEKFVILPLEEIVKALKEKKELPDKTVAITIDDAYLSVYEAAFPLLREKGFPFTVFVATNSVTDGSPAYMSWDHVREMMKHGGTFANHSVNHDYLIRRFDGESLQEWRERIIIDLQSAQKRLQDELGKAPMLFAYPYGEYNAELLKIVKELGYTAFGQHSGAAGGGSDLRALPRYPMAEQFADMTSFKTKAMSLAMPVIRKEPVDPSTTDLRPQLKVTLDSMNSDLSRLTCYFGSQVMKIDWLKTNEQFSIQAETDIPTGRSRYNCTIPDLTSGRYYWFSHLWIRLDKK